ncbi:MAG: tripartite tricarboxylate transporter substrate binding protein [Pseudomonadota bacterium]|nr:tripartite tricarboxylate transporter substrate binding protein [Pseudomonadota bacterium]
MTKELRIETVGGERRRIVGALAATAALLAFPVRAQSFPARPFRLIVPFPPGGPTDIVARPFAQMLGDLSGQQVIVDNRGGAGGSIGADIVAKAAPDGYSLLIGTVGTHAINPALYRKLPYDATKDFTALGLIASAPVAVAVHPRAPYASIAELIAAAKKDPGGINFGSAGNGTPGHLIGEMFAKAAGIELKHVPYKGSAPAVSDLLSGQIPLMFDPVQSVLQHVRGGKLRALAVSSAERSSVLPQVPTLNESGLKGFEATAWWALFAPAGLPPAVAATLTASARHIVDTPAFRDRLLEVGVQTPKGSTPAFADFQRAELAKWGRAVRDSGVTLD